jgi:hypothetical protein
MSSIVDDTWGRASVSLSACQTRTCIAVFRTGENTDYKQNRNDIQKLFHDYLSCPLVPVDSINIDRPQRYLHLQVAEWVN